MRFFLYEIVARIVAIYLFVDYSRKLWFGLVERKIGYVVRDGDFLRVRPAILRAGCEPYNSAQHEADHCKNDETDVATREVLVIFDNAPAAPEPTVRALNYPALWAICRNPWRYLSA
jgi:hypothetical protein